MLTSPLSPRSSVDSPSLESFKPPQPSTAATSLMISLRTPSTINGDAAASPAVATPSIPPTSSATAAPQRPLLPRLLRGRGRPRLPLFLRGRGRPLLLRRQKIHSSLIMQSEEGTCSGALAVDSALPCLAVDSGAPMSGCYFCNQRIQALPCEGPMECMQCIEQFVSEREVGVATNRMEAQIRNEKYVLEKCIAQMRMAFDQQQQDLVDLFKLSTIATRHLISSNRT